MYLFTYLFILFFDQIFLRNIFFKNLSGYISKNFLYIMTYKYNIFEFISYLVGRKEQSKIREKVEKRLEKSNY